MLETALRVEIRHLPSRLIAYFDESIEHTLGLVPRQAFERRLQQHYSHPLSADADPAWYGLRHAVFAIGSRLALCHGGGPMNYAAARRQSWPYFANAMAVLTNLVYMPSDITAVECILLMVRRKPIIHLCICD